MDLDEDFWGGRSSIEMPQGRLYRPLKDGWQILILIIVIIAGPVIGWLIGAIPGDLSESARNSLGLPFFVILAIGYLIWMARVSAVLFGSVGGALFRLFTRKEKPRTLEEIYSREKILQATLKAQKTGTIFRAVSWPIAIITGLAALFFNTEMSSLVLSALVMAACLGWGYLLAYLGRRGFLPLGGASHPILDRRHDLVDGSFDSD